MNKYLTALAIFVGSVSGVAHAQCGPNGCHADSAQFNAMYGEKPTTYSQGYQSTGYSNNYGTNHSKPCNCSR